jgi:hypothetical protein
VRWGQDDDASGKKREETSSWRIQTPILALSGTDLVQRSIPASGYDRQAAVLDTVGPA